VIEKVVSPGFEVLAAPFRIRVSLLALYAIRDYWRNGPRDHAAEAAGYHSVKLRVDYQRAALWLKQARPIYETDVRPWLRAVVSTYAEWTRQANGFEQEGDAQYDDQPDGWNEVYFELAAKCAAGLSSDALDQELQGLFAGLPDESICDCLPIFQRSADQAFFEKNLMSTEQMIQIRTFLRQRLSETRVFDWNKDRDEASARGASCARSRANLLQRSQ
jgi:hypothetical protein